MIHHTTTYHNAESRLTLNRWVFSLLQKLVSESAILTSAESSFHHCGARTERSWDWRNDVCLFLVKVVPFI